MTGPDENLAVMFADITGSTRLYESSGDAQAFKMISGCIGRLTAIVEKHKGTVIKSMGDGLMASFTSADEALWVGSVLQGSEADQDLDVSVGFDFGPVIERDGDVFGDTVNVAARLSDLARGGEILMTEKAADLLSPPLRGQTAFFDKMHLRGRAEPLRVYRFEPPQVDQTEILSATGVGGQSVAALLLRYHGSDILVSAETDGFVLGRGDGCDLQVLQTHVSRQHALIEFRRGNFYLTDQSTNGTYVVNETDECIQLKRESAQLSGSGVLSLGRAPARNQGELIEFRRGD